MTRIQRLMKLHRLMDKAGEHGSDGGGTGTGDSGAGGGEGGAGEGGAGEGGDKGGEGGDGGDSGKGGAGEGDKGGKPSDSEAKLLKDVMKHKGRAQELETQLSQVNEKLKLFEGIDPAKVRALLAEQEELERKRLEAKGDYDRLVAQMGERHKTEKSELLSKIEERDRATQSLQQQIAELTVGSAFTTSEFVKELTLTPNKARVIYGSHFEFKDGKVVGYDKPAGASERTMLVDSTGEALSFEEAMKKIIEADPDRDQLIKSKVKPGAASSTAPKGAKKAGEQQGAQLSSVERIAAGLKALANKK